MLDLFWNVEWDIRRGGVWVLSCKLELWLSVFIEFQTNECVSDDKETIKQIDTKSSTVTDDGVDLRNV